MISTEVEKVWKVMVPISWVELGSMRAMLMWGLEVRSLSELRWETV